MTIITSNITITLYHCHHVRITIISSIIIHYLPLLYPHLLHHDILGMFMSMSYLALIFVTHNERKTKEPTFAKLQRWVSELQNGPFLSNLPFISSQLGHKSPGPRIIAKEMATGALQQWSDDLASFLPLQKEGAKWGLREAFGMWNDKTSQTLYDSWRSWWSVCKNTQAHTQHTNIIDIQVFPKLKSW